MNSDSENDKICTVAAVEILKSELRVTFEMPQLSDLQKCV
jgi:hypothetical protein